MTGYKTSLMVAVICILLLHELKTIEVEAKTKTIDCNSKCAYRCSKASRQKMCIRACNSCCQRCHCVPPGTSGNTNVCPCYAHLKTHGGRLKCP